MRQAFTVLFAVMALLGACKTSPEARSARHMDAGAKLLQRNEASRAILEFRNAIQATPANAEAYYQLGLAFLAGADAVRAVSSFRHTLELNGAHAGAQLKLAQILAGVNDPAMWSDAQKRLEALLNDNPANSTALHALALTEMQLGGSEKAVRHLERAMSLAPRELMPAITLAQAKMQANDVKGAEQMLKAFSASSPKSPDGAIVLGQFYELQNDLVQAEDQFQKAVLTDPKSVPALYGLAALQLKRGRKQEAEATFKKLADVPYTPIRTLYGAFLFEEGRREEAIREFERVFDQDPEDRTARTRLIAAYSVVNRSPDALKIVQDALKKNPKDLEALLQRGELWLAAGKLPEAEIDLNEVVRRRPDSAGARYVLAKLHRARGDALVYRQDLIEVLRLDPSAVVVRAELAKALLAENEGKGALGVLDQTPEAQRNLPPIIEQRNWALLATGDPAAARKGVDQGLAIERTGDLLLQDAVLKMAVKRFAEARQPLEEALSKAPADLRLLRAVVGSYAAQNQTAAAVNIVRAHAEKHPESADVQFFLGNLLLESGKQAEAKRVFTSVKALNPHYVPADLELARINLRQSNWSDARQQLGAILHSQENTTARLWLGMLEESVGNHAAAITAFRKVVDTEPKHVTALNNLAYLLAEQGNTDEALNFAQKAKELEPDTARVEDTLGWVLYHKGVYSVAVKYLEMANAREGTAVRKYHLAMAYLKAGERERGRAALKAALRLDPNLSEAQAARELFR
jgi:tetratricopeptide (TPR) repeat protein